MQAILSRARADGTFPTVGTDGVTVALDGQYQSIRALVRYMVKPFARGRQVQVEVFYSSVYANPSKVFVYSPEGR